MLMIQNILLLLLLFIALGLAAELVVDNIKYLAKTLKMRLFAFGILLGIITSLPELSVGINAGINNLGAVSVGNLLGGVLVMLGLILGASLVLHRKVKTDGKLIAILPELSIIIIPLFLGMDGTFSRFDGLMMITAYFALIFYLYRINKKSGKITFAALDKNRILKAIFFALIGTVAVLLISNWIVRIASEIINTFHVNELAIGLIFFAIGTNLPEISIAFTSWRKKTAELSLNHLLSSAFTNILILGILSVLRPIAITTGLHYFLVTMFIIINIGLFIIFYKTQKKLDKNEGLALIFCYAFFIIANFWALGQT